MDNAKLRALLKRKLACQDAVEVCKCSKAQDDGSVCGVDAGRTDYCNLSYLLETVEAALRSCHESITAAKHMLTECNQAIAVRDSANQSLRDQVAAYEPVILRIKQLQYAGIGDEPLVIVDTKRGPVPAALKALSDSDERAQRTALPEKDDV